MKYKIKDFFYNNALELVLLVGLIIIVFCSHMTDAEEINNSPFQNPNPSGFLSEVDDNKYENIKLYADSVSSTATQNQWKINVIKAFVSNYILGSADLITDFTTYLINEGIEDQIQIINGYLSLKDDSWIKDKADEYYYHNGLTQPSVMLGGYWYKGGSFSYYWNGSLVTTVDDGTWFAWESGDRYLRLYSARIDRAYPNTTPVGGGGSYYNGSGGGYYSSSYGPQLSPVAGNDITFNGASYGWNRDTLFNAIWNNSDIPTGELTFNGNLYLNERPQPLNIPIRNTFYTDYTEVAKGLYEDIFEDSPNENSWPTVSPSLYTDIFSEPTYIDIPYNGDLYFNVPSMPNYSAQDFNEVAPVINNNIITDMSIPPFFQTIIIIMVVFLVLGVAL